MSIQRCIDWSASLRTMRNNRTAAADRRARRRHGRPQPCGSHSGVVANEAVRAADAAPPVVDGAYDKAAIMRRVHARARRTHAHGEARSWRELISHELRPAWQAARASRRTTQVETLKRYRSTGQQTVRVERVTVEAGGQAVVGAVNAPAAGGGAP